jgi:hypothetical protein
VLHVVGGRLDEVAAYTPDARTLASTPKAAWRLPLKLFEYMAAWRPIIASRPARGRRRPGRPSVPGLLPDSEGPAAWRRAVTRPRYDPDLGGRLGAAALAELRGLPTRQARARRILAFFDGASADWRPRSIRRGCAGYLATPRHSRYPA